MKRAPVNIFVPEETHHSDCHFENQRLMFERQGRILLAGFDAIHCEIVIRRGVELLIAEGNFRECTIVSESLKGERGGRARFEECVFQGTFRDWNFGGKSDTESVLRCDFRRADLHDCEFFGCDIRVQRFGKWPSTVLIAPHEHRDKIRMAPWPRTPEAVRWLEITTSWFPGTNRSKMPHLAGLALNGERVAEELRIPSFTLREILETLGDIVIL